VCLAYGTGWSSAFQNVRLRRLVVLDDVQYVLYSRIQLNNKYSCRNNPVEISLRMSLHFSSQPMSSPNIFIFCYRHSLRLLYLALLNTGAKRRVALYAYTDAMLIFALIERLLGTWRAFAEGWPPTSDYSITVFALHFQQVIQILCCCLWFIPFSLLAYVNCKASSNHMKFD
jgi:hypothetical protein